ncbi:MAG: hypothetical protein AB7H93_00935 [Vicinamibacterales bacterium]
MADRLVTTMACVLVLASGVPALAQGPCAVLTAQGPTLAGFAGAKTDTAASGDRTVCEMWSSDRTARLSLIVEPPQAARGLAMRKVLTANAQEPGMTVRDEPTLGVGAFSFASRQQASVIAAGKGGLYTLALNRDAGIAVPDADRLRAIARQLVDGR